MPQRAIEYLKETLPDYLKELETLVGIDSGTGQLDGIGQIARFVARRLASLDYSVKIYHDELYGDTLVGRRHGWGSANILILGHMDTVYPPGTASQRPLTMGTDGRVAGPGVADMKGGLLNVLYALDFLAATESRPYRTLTVICNPDEEVGSPSSRSIIEEEAARADCALVVEAAWEDGSLISSRRGRGVFKLAVRGKAAHAGAAPEEGASAHVEIAYQILKLHTLNGIRPGVTVNVGTLRGGLRPNVVPDWAEAEVDVRAATLGDAEAVQQRMMELVATTHVAGTSASLSGNWTRFPMEKTRRTAQLVTFAQLTARELGFEVRDVHSGSSSDANLTAALGVPTLDGLGPVGGREHSPEEYILLDSIVPRTALLARLIEKIAACF
jgi:glutamate carboxypeptidase